MRPDLNHFLTFQMVRPYYSAASRHFQAIHGDGSLGHVANLLGGKVKVNIDGGFFRNAFAIRMSYVLNKSGTRVPSLGGKTVSGSDGAQYIFRVKDLIVFMNERYGPPDRLVSNPTPSDLGHMMGIVIFEVSGWSDASGHATLWNGVSCLDSCYFQNASALMLWELK